MDGQNKVTTYAIPAHRCMLWTRTCGAVLLLLLCC